MTDLKAALLLCHVRSSRLATTLSLLRQFGIQRVYVSVDGPRNDLDKQNQLLIFQIIETMSRNFQQFEIRAHSKNLGIGVAVISALDWFFGQEERGVIIEDDLEFNLDFLRFAEEGLNRFKDNSEVWMISGSRLIPKSHENAGLKGRTLAANYPIIWGWASWSSRWKEMLNGILNPPIPKSALPRSVKYFWLKGHERVRKGIVDTWDIPLAASMRFLGKKTIIPPVNLVSNKGFDEFASNEMHQGFPLGLEIFDLPLVKNQLTKEDVNWWSVSSFQTELNVVNSILEEEVFNISRRHIFLKVYGPLLDFFFWFIKRPVSLTERLKGARSAP